MITNIYVDGSGGPKSGYGFFVKETGESFFEEKPGITNNQAEYLAIISALKKYDKPPVKDAFSNSVEIIRNLCNKAKNLGIKIGLEPVNRYESNLINTASQAMDFIKLSESDNLFVHLDSYHMNIEAVSYTHLTLPTTPYV